MITAQPEVVIAGRYVLVRPLASGGMGSVWLARHRELEIDVTVKFVADSLVASSEARMRFEREAKVAARLRSQYVVQVLDYGVEDGTPYMVMELLDGESVAQRLAREGRLTLAAAARMVAQVGKALRTAHENGLVHRDLKPSNVFLALKDGDEVVKILDFGIVKASGLGGEDGGTESGMMLGSIHYMSPEQIRSSRGVDHRSDLWSVGVILYRALTGKLPFAGQGAGEVLVRVCTEPFAPASSIARDLPARVDPFFARALARDPDQRFQSAHELSEAFAAIALEAPLQPALEQSAQRWESTQSMMTAVRRPRPAPSPAVDVQISAVAPSVDPPSESVPGTAVTTHDSPHSAAGVSQEVAARARVRPRWLLWGAAAGVPLAAAIVVAFQQGRVLHDAPAAVPSAHDVGGARPLVAGAPVPAGEPAASAHADPALPASVSPTSSATLGREKVEGARSDAIPAVEARPRAAAPKPLPAMGNKPKDRALVMP